MSDFLNRVKGVVNKGVTTASVKLKESVEIGKIDTKLKSLSSDKNERILELGNIVYTLFKQGTLKDQRTRIEEKCGAIQDIDRKIQDAENEIMRVRKETEEFLGRTQSSFLSDIKCNCGNMIKQGAKFCTSCGRNVSELPVDLEKEKSVLSSCSNCGAQRTNTDAKFCQQCGSSFSQPSSQA